VWVVFFWGNVISDILFFAALIKNGIDVKFGASGASMNFFYISLLVD